MVNGMTSMKQTNAKLFQWLQDHHKYVYFVPLGFFIVSVFSSRIFILVFFFPWIFYCFCLIMIHLGVEMIRDTECSVRRPHRSQSAIMEIIHFHRSKLRQRQTIDTETRTPLFAYIICCVPRNNATYRPTQRTNGAYSNYFSPYLRQT